MLTEILQVAVAYGASAGDERQPSDTLALVVSGGFEHFLIRQVRIFRASCIEMSRLGAPAAVLAAASGAGVDNRAGVNQGRLEGTADAVGGIAKLIEVGPYGQNVGFRPGDTSAIDQT